MSELSINGTIYNYPDPGQEPGWGQDATDWAKAVTEAINSILGAGSITETQGIINNNVPVSTEIPGLTFNSSLTLSVIVFYRIFRDTDAISPLNEEGLINILVDGGTWKMSREILAGEPTGVVIDVNGTGQLVYTSTNLPGANYQGVIKFKTISIIS